jgi:hypothetical protein
VHVQVQHPATADNQPFSLRATRLELLLMALGSRNM